MIVLIGGEKGGTGKTTLATSLAAQRAQEGHDVLLLDTDLQGSASKWIKVRDHLKVEPSISSVQKTGEIDVEVRRLAKKYQDIIIDIVGKDSNEFRTGLMVAHKAIIPITPGNFNVWTISQVDKIIENIKNSINRGLEANIILNQASTHASINDYQELKEYLEQSSSVRNLKLLPFSIGYRRAFIKAPADGLGVSELDSAEKKAVSEITKLYKEVFDDNKE